MALLGIDIGSSSVKAVVVNADGTVLGKAEHPQLISTPHPLWSQQNPEDWHSASCAVIRDVLQRVGITGRQIEGIGLSGQMVGLVVLDKNRQVLRPCILWNDQRSVMVTERLTESIGLSNILQATSNPLFPTFVAPKLVWMREHEPDLYRQIAQVLMPKDYVRLRLTGEVATEVSDASGTCVFNVAQRAWSSRMLDAMNLPREWWPNCLESTDVAGQITETVARDTGLAAGTPVVAGGGDQPIQAIGSGVVRPGRCAVTIGTSGVVFAQCAGHVKHPTGLLHAFCHSIPNQWYLMGVMLCAGGAFQWLANTLGKHHESDYEAMTDLAQTVAPGSEGLIFLPYLSGERVPHADPYARGGWIGLTSRHDQGHLIRSVMEGITFGLCDSLKLIEQMGRPIDRVYASGGATKSQFWRQMLADAFGKPIVITHVTEGGAYGAAMLGGVGAGLFASVEQAAQSMIRETQIIEPDPQQAPLYAEPYAIYQAAYKPLKDVMRRLSTNCSLERNETCPNAQ